MREINITNIGWTLGNDCPCKCNHCYSFDVRRKGMDLTKAMVNRVLSQIFKLKVETVNIGGNEPVFTNGLDVKKSMLPYILKELDKNGVKVGITTSGISLIALKDHYPDALQLLNDVDISLDSPYESEHNANRGGDVFRMAIEALDICQKYHLQSGLIMCAMNWNFTIDRLEKLLAIACNYNATVRINILKPTEQKHFELIPSKEQIDAGYRFLFKNADIVDLSEPTLAKAAHNSKVKGCSCGIHSLRINSITPDGKIMVSPCVYMHDFRVGDLLTDDIYDILASKQFKEFEYRRENYRRISECADCENSEICRGGCFAMAYTYEKCKTGEKNLFARDPFCTKQLSGVPAKISFSHEDFTLVHQNYLCTCIVKPKK